MNYVCNYSCLPLIVEVIHLHVLQNNLVVEDIVVEKDDQEALLVL